MKLDDRDISVDQRFRQLIPPLLLEDYEQLEQNLLRDGIRDPLVFWGNVLIDGHNRFEIAQQYGLEYKIVSRNFNNEDEAKEWIIRNQFGRRNLNAYDRSLLAERLKNVIAARAKQKQVQSGGDKKSQNARSVPPKLAEPILETREELAQIAGVSHGTISKVEKIEAQAIPEVKENVRHGDISINQGYELSKQPTDKQKAIADKLSAGEAKTVAQAVTQIKKQAARQELADKGAAITATTYDIRLGNFMEVFADIPDGSVDCIITDPPYPYDYIDCWSQLSLFAHRVLKPHGFCIAYSGQMHLPEVIRRLSEHLDYYWCMALHHLGKTQIVNGVNMMCLWKPILIFQNGKKLNPHIIQDFFDNVRPEKTAHDWQQGESGMTYLIEKYTEPGDIILDPFCGSGTTIAVANKLKRHCKGAEIELETYNIAKGRLSSNDML
jgi:ParB-like chromosome segregation protein Spo0J